MDKKYQIFISSTYTDLIEERKAIQETILSMYHIPIGMEMFSADDIDQWEIIKDTIDTSDYYILIVGHRYGSITKEGISYTQKEYEYALEKKIPILGFVIDPNIPVLPNDIDSDLEKKQKLSEFKNLIMKKPIEWWTDKKDLSAKVAIALTKQIGRKNRPGWIRADQFNLEETQNELIKLLKRNRELEEENKELRNKIVQRKPQIDIQIKNINQDKLQVISPLQIERIQKDVEVEYYKIENDILDEKQKCNDKFLKKIEEYNNSIPSQEIIDDYIEELKKYEAIKKYNNPIEVQIFNNGTCSANHLSVTLEFPNEIIIKHKNEIDNLERPKAPPKNENPLFPNLDFLSTGAFNLPSQNSFLDRGLSFSNYFISPNRPDELNGNVLEVYYANLMHTYTITIDDYIIATTKPGKYNVKCEIICEEFIEPEKLQITLEF